MAKPFGYERGAVKYVIKSILFNAIPMYIFGGGILSVLEAIQHSIGDGFLTGVVMYFITKYLPPTSLQQVFAQVAIGAVVAGILWYVKTPRQGHYYASR